MITTSDAWKNLITTEDLLPESNVNLVSNNDVQDTSSWKVTTTGAEDISDESVLLSSPATINRNTFKIATLEWNFWVLDGSYEVPTEETTVNGYISKEATNDIGQFQNLNSVNIELTGSVNVAKKYMTLKYAPDINEYATSCTIIDSSEATSSDFEEPEEYHHVTIPENESNNFVLIIHEWSMPYRKARINELLLGARLFFDKSVLSNFKHQRTGDMVNSELPQNDCSFSVLDINNDYDVNNANAKFANMINTSTTFNLYYGYKIDGNWEYHFIDCFYNEKFERPANGIEARFNLESNLNRKTQTFTSDETVSWTSYNRLLQIISSKMGVTITRSGGNFATTEKTLLSATIKNALRDEFYEMPMNEWLQLTACVINAFIFRNADGTFEIRGITSETGKITSSTIVDSIPLNNCFEYPEIETVDMLRNISLTTSPIIDAQKDNPDSGGEAEVGGQTVAYPPYRYTRKSIVPGTDLAAENKLIVLGNYSSSEYFSQSDNLVWSYIYWLEAFISESKKIKANMRINPAWQIGDLVKIELKSGVFVKGFIIDIDINYAGCLKGDLTILVPKYINN